MNHTFYPELLAPAGNSTILKRVAEAGADAVYVSGKKFNMRRHRKDYHFTDDELREAALFLHECGKKLYVTVNSLIGDTERDALTEYLHFLYSVNVDAIIVQDYGVISLVQSEKIPLPLHASTMMNCNSTEYARFLKSQGITRVVTSRDITIDEVSRIRDEADIEVEYFIHGDMCTAQSGQCVGSGIIFGKSSNRGQCMKPCRWAFDLIASSSDEVVKKGVYALASKDMFLIEHIPDLITARVDSFKIEGRMKSADILVPIVHAYRKAIDRYCASPLSYHRDVKTISSLMHARVRDLTTGFAFQSPGAEYLDYSGEREPIFLSYGAHVQTITSIEDAFIEERGEKKSTPELTCVVGTIESLDAALAAGADTIILSWEGDLKSTSSWSTEEVHTVLEKCRMLNRRCVMASPKIMTRREVHEMALFVSQFPEVSTYSISSPAVLSLLLHAQKEVWIDTSFNVLNSKACAFWRDQGVSRIMPSLEASFQSVRDMIQMDPLVEYDIAAHGIIPFMLIEHCIVAMAIQGVGKKDVCQMPCSADEFVLRDHTGTRRLLKTDRYCRTHMLLEHELCIMPSYESFLTIGAKSFRIDARTYTPEKTRMIVSLYHEAITKKRPLSEIVKEMTAYYGTTACTYGAYMRGILRDDERSLASLKQEERYAP